MQAILDQKGPGWWLDYLPQVTARWLGGHVLNREEDQDPTLLVDFLAGSDEAGHMLSADYYGCLQVYRMVSQHPCGTHAPRVVLLVLLPKWAAGASLELIHGWLMMAWLDNARESSSC